MTIRLTEEKVRYIVRDELDKWLKYMNTIIPDKSDFFTTR